MYWNFVFFLSFISLLYCTKAGGQCKDKFKVFPDHTACLQRSTKASIPHAGDNQDALDVHNKYRLEAVHQYKATDILKMIWDDEVAMIAQKWAENCEPRHDQNYQRIIPGRFTVGQNIASSQTPLTWESVVQLFYNESRDFKYNGTNDFTKVGHFTQLTWAKSYILGCGYAVCGGYHFYVCNYAPGGNSNGQIGKPFSTSGTTSVLIDCHGRKCEGGSDLDPKTCQCKCRNSNNFYRSSAELCKLSCKTKLKEKFFCGTYQGYKEENCLELANMPFDCPKTCHVCPYADDKSYVEGSQSVVGLMNQGISPRTSDIIFYTLFCTYLFSLVSFLDPTFV